MKYEIRKFLVASFEITKIQDKFHQRIEILVATELGRGMNDKEEGVAFGPWFFSSALLFSDWVILLDS